MAARVKDYLYLFAAAALAIYAMLHLISTPVALERAMLVLQ